MELGYEIGNLELNLGLETWRLKLGYEIGNVELGLHMNMMEDHGSNKCSRVEPDAMAEIERQAAMLP